MTIWQRLVRVSQGSRPQARVRRLQQLRRERKLSQEALGRLVSMSPSMICRFERGRRDIPTTKAKAIADIFDRPIEDIFEFVEKLA